MQVNVHIATSTHTYIRTHTHTNTCTSNNTHDTFDTVGMTHDVGGDDVR